MQTLLIERMEPGNPDSLYRAVIGDAVYEGLTYQEAIKTNGDSKLGQLYRLAIKLTKKQLEEEGK